MSATETCAEQIRVRITYMRDRDLRLRGVCALSTIEGTVLRVVGVSDHVLRLQAMLPAHRCRHCLALLLR